MSRTAAVPACRLRPAGPADEAALALVGQASFLEAFAGTLRGSDILEHCASKNSRQLYRDWLSDPRVSVWLAETLQGSAPVGYLALTPPDLPLPDLAASDLEIRRVYLLHRFQGQGLGRGLMECARAAAAQRGCRRLLLGVYSGNETALGFYAALGYRTVGRRTFRVGESECQDLILGLRLEA